MSEPAQDKPVWRNHGQYSVKGTAMEKDAEAITAAYSEALAAVAHLDRDELTEKVTYLYGRTEYTLNYDACSGLSDIEKVALAYGGIPPFGGTVRGIRVTIYND